MKITVNDKSEQEKEITYPCLMKDDDGMIVLFSEREKGTVIYNGNHPYYVVGYISFGWIMSIFTPFHGTITLEQG